MYVLGIDCFYHDAAACILKGGKVVAAAEEERFTRVKHDIRFPINAIKYCLEEANIDINQVDYVAFYEKPLIKFERVLHQFLETFPFSFWTFFNTVPSWLNEKLRVARAIRKKVGFKGDILYVEHHLAHAASAFLPSPFKEAAILTIDGVGEWATATYGYGKDNKITLLKELRFPHSLGLLYSTITAYLGFKVNNDEYKVMGLAAYGEPTYYEKLKEIVDLKKDGSLFFDMSYFDYHYKMTMPSKKMVEEFGPIRKSGEKLTQHHKDMACSLQKLTEEIVINMLKHLYKETRCRNLCMAGGVALNSVTNGKILRNTPFKDIFIPPAAGDGGTSLGTALYAYNSILGKKRNYVLKSAALGPSFTTEEIKSFLDENEIKYKIFKNDKELVKTTAKLIHNNKIVGWFQGRMEWGPRALGFRSILANPHNPNMKDILNKRVKHREEFRPFAPAVPVSDTKKYFECDNPIPYPADFMLMVYPTRERKQKLIPSAIHIDGSGRLQTVRKSQNPLYYKVIKEFGKLSGVPIVINTSFNIRGEPIVCTPADAYRCMMGTGIDYTVMDKFIIARKDNPKDMWDSWGSRKK